MARYDYIIAGAGSAGCVLANRLSADPGTTVLLVEAGGADRHPLLHVPKGSGKLFENEKYVWRYATTPFGPRKRSEFWTRGKVLGGSSSINGMVYNRGNQADYDELERLGNKGWGWKDILPIFVAMEDNAFGRSPTRGTGGPLHVSVSPDQDIVSRELIQSGTGVGLAQVPDINESDEPRIGFTPATIRRGRRVSAADAFLRPARRRANLTVLPRTEVCRILIEHDRAVGITVRTASGAETELRAEHEIILALGSMGSPKLLQLSGIGPRDVLDGAGVPVVLERDNVGRRMREHRCFALKYRLNADLGYNRQLSSRSGQARSAARYLARRRGSLATPTFDVLAFMKTTPDAERVDGQLLLSPFTIPAYNDGEPVALESEPGVSCLGFALRPTSEGSVAITAADPAAPLLLDPRYLTSDHDRMTTANLMRRARELFERSPIAGRIDHETFPGPQAQSDDDLVDERLRVRGIDALRIVDCSAMPIMVAGT